MHNLNALFGVEAIKYTFENVGAARTKYAFEDDDYMHIDSGEGAQTNNGTKRQWGLFSIFAKVDYNFADRYLASFTIRRDQSSRLDKTAIRVCSRLSLWHGVRHRSHSSLKTMCFPTLRFVSHGGRTVTPPSTTGMHLIALMPITWATGLMTLTARIPARFRHNCGYYR